MTKIPAILQPEVDRLCALLGREFAVEPGDIFGKHRCKSLVSARFAAFMLLRERYQLSFPELGRMVGFDHTTVIYGVKRAQQLEAQGELYRMQVYVARREWLQQSAPVYSIKERVRVA